MVRGCGEGGATRDSPTAEIQQVERDGEGGQSELENGSDGKAGQNSDGKGCQSEPENGSDGEAVQNEPESELNNERARGDKDKKRRGIKRIRGVKRIRRRRRISIRKRRRNRRATRARHENRSMANDVLLPTEGQVTRIRRVSMMLPRAPDRSTKVRTPQRLRQPKRGDPP